MKKLFSWASTVFGFAMFFVALWVIRQELHGRSVAEVFGAAGMVPPYQLLIAFSITVVCYLLLTGYDVLAVHALADRPRWASVMVNSFICHAMSINVGCSAVTGGSLRCQYYLRKGMKGTEVIRIVTFCLVTFWLGFLALGGTIFLFLPPAVPEFVHLPFATLQPLGALLLLALAAYFFIILVHRRPVSVRGWVIPVIPARVTLAQIGIAASEWILGTAVLFALLPHHPELTYFHLLSFYFLAQVSGLISQVPSGLGVFESIILALVPESLDPSMVVGALLLYRLIFSLLPLSAAGLLLLVREVRYRRLAVA
ncbi:MAG: UPF0104 family protein [Candidatus Peribacteraceae bacterium]|nr:UPF0104 family protein [Candidatus Peribacteraceae bacterium]